MIDTRDKSKLIMRRIFITGNAGSGKTVLSRKLGLIFGWSVKSLDQVVWQPGWVMTSYEERIKLTADIIKPETWIIEGVSSAVLQAADTVIFLDFSRKVSYWRLCKRNWKYLFRSRPELPEHCPEILIVKRLIKLVWNFYEHVRPTILKHLRAENKNKNIFHIRSNKDLKRFIKQIQIV